MGEKEAMLIQMVIRTDVSIREADGSIYRWTRQPSSAHAATVAQPSLGRILGISI
jgi:hypothetical protein